MKKLFYIFACLCSLVAFRANAAAPTWSVNPGSFQYNMTMVAVASINCTELTNASNRIGVFVGGQCRGTALTSQVVNGRYTVSLFIYSNSVQGETLNFKVYNATQDSVYDIPTTLGFQQNASFGTSNVPYVLLNNNPPSMLSASTSSFNENLSINSTVATLSATDPDAGETFTYTLVNGDGATHNSLFTISGSSLKVSSVINYEQIKTCSVRLRVTDSRTCYYEKVISFNVTDVNEAPYAIYINDSTINENLPANTSFASLSGVDPDADDVLTFSLATGAGDSNNASFIIVGNTLRTSQSFNYEAKSSYGIRVRVRDMSNNTYERTIVVLVRDVNDNPSNMLMNGSASAASFAENRGIGSLCATLSTIDEDAGSVFSYSFVNTGGNDNANFQIVGNQIRSNIAFDYESRQTYSVFIQSSDGLGGTISKQFLLNVTDSNDAPVSIGLSGTSIFENLPAGSFLAKLSTNDPDQNQTAFTYALVNGSGSAGNASFFVRNDSLFSNTIFNYENLSSYSIRLSSTDPGSASVQQSFNLTILDANDAPTDMIINSSAIAENQAIGITVGSFSTSDQDANSSFIYSLVSGAGATDNASFSIVGNSLKTNAVFDFETKSSYSIRVRTADGNGGTFEKSFVITVTDANDAPTNINLSNASIKENVAVNTLIGTFSSTDVDATAAHTYTFDAVAGNDNASFLIVGNQLRTQAALNYENKSVYYIQVMSSDGNGGTFSKQFMISVLDSNDAPTDIVLNSPTITENQSTGAFIGQLSTVDEDASGTYIYSLVSGSGSTHNASFFVRNDSIFGAQILDFELINTFNIRVRSTNSGLFVEKAFVLRVVNGNDAPTDITLSNNLVQENLPQGTLIGAFSSLDPDTGNIFTYALVPGSGATNNNLFVITGSQLRTAASFNYENNASYSIRVQTNDGNGGTFSKVFTVSVLDANDAPNQISLSAAGIKENKPANSLVGIITGTDEDANSNLVYSLVNSTNNNNGSFFISGNQLRTNAMFDYESKSNYVIQIQANDGNGGIFEKQFAISVLDSNDAPSGITLSSTTLEENSIQGTFIGVLSSLDADANSTSTYTLVAGAGSTSNAMFQVRTDSLFTNANFNFETTSSASIRVRVTDNGGLSADQVIGISIIDRNDAPSNLLLDNAAVSENLPSRTIIGKLTAVDEDANNSFSYTLVSGTGSTDNSFFNINGSDLRTNAKFDYENKSTYSIRLQVNDGRGGSFEKQLNISVLDSNDAPSQLVLSNNSIAENRAAGSLVGILSTVDEDAGDQFNYSFFNGSSNQNGQFILVNNQLRTAAKFNYEERDFYLIYVSGLDANGLSITRQFIININDSADAPTDINISNTEIAENEGAHAFIGLLSATDEDQLNGFSYSFIGGSGASNNNLFEVSNDSLFAKNSFDFESASQYSFRLKVKDNTNASFEKAFTIQVSNANDAPDLLVLDNATINENNAANATIGSLSASDQDLNETFKYELVSGTGDNDNASFSILGNSLQIKGSSNFEAKPAYSIRIKVLDSKSASFENVFVIQVKDMAEKPSINADTFYIREKEALGTLVGTLSASSPDAGALLNYELLNAAPFKINSVTGDITINDVLDYESTHSYVLQVKVSDSRDETLNAITQVIIRIEDVLETETDLPALNFVSPNGDGLNDAFTINNVELYKDYSLSIFNESGLEVFSQLSNYKNDWMGTYNGQKLPTGVYFYVFKKGSSEFKGSISIIQ